MLPRPLAPVPPAPSPVLPPGAGGGAGRRIGPWYVVGPMGPGTFRAVEGASGAEVAVKVASSGSPAAARLAGERRALAALGAGDHPALVTGAGSVDDGRIVAVATVLVAGPALDEQLETEGTMSFVEAAALLAPVADALASIHDQGWVHGDVSAANIVLGPGGAVLVDLGAARPIDEPGQATASPGSAPPEVVAGTAPTTASDVWALAAVVVGAVTGAPPTTGTPLAAPMALGLGRALALDPARRPTAAQLADALATIGAGAPARPGVTTPFPSMRPTRPTPPPVPRSARVTIEFGPRPPRPTLVAASRPVPPRAVVAVMACGAALAAALVGAQLGGASRPGPPPAPPPSSTIAGVAPAPPG